MSLARNTMFALLMAIEKDLGAAIGRAYSDDAGPLLPTEKEAALGRWQRDRDATEAPKRWQQLWDYLTLGEKLDVMARSAEPLAIALGIEAAGLRRAHKALTPLSAVRNRVCHNRPPEPQDFPLTVDTTKQVLQEQGFPFDELALEFERLTDRSVYPFTLAIPTFWTTDAPRVANNLPIPEWDETGYIGRDSDRRSLTKLLVGSHPVINVTGEGGVGKTAIITRCMYDLLEMPDQPYEAMVWTSLKADRLTTSGVQALVGAMASEIEVMAAILDRFGGPDPTTAGSTLFDQVRYVLSQLRVLVAIDNIETIDREALRPLLMEIPVGSKLILTSRIGIGEIEVRFPLDPLTATDAVNLFRRTALLFGIDSLYTRDREVLEKYCERLYFNPLAIKWFIQSYVEGRSVNALLSSRRSQQTLLDFCFKNVFEAFSNEQHRILRTLVAAPGPLSEVQIALLAEIDDTELVRQNIEYLMSSNVVKRIHDAWGANNQAMLWTPTSFARRYVQDDPLIKGDRPRVAKAYRALIGLRNEARTGRIEDYRPMAIRAESTDEAMVARSLTAALSSAYAKDFAQAQSHLATAKKLLPDFSETYRISAQVKELAGDNAGAREDFDMALDIATGRGVKSLAVYFAQFLRRQGDPYTALTILERIASEYPNDLVVAAEMATCSLQAGELPHAFRCLDVLEEGLLEASGSVDPIALGGLVTSLGETLDASKAGDNEDELARVSLRLLSRTSALLSREPSFPLAAQTALRIACRHLSSTCDMTRWEEIASYALLLAKVVPMTGTDNTEFDLLQSQCPMIARTTSYERVRGRSRSIGQGGRRSSRIQGRLKRFPRDRDYTFVAGLDGNDYFFHKTQLTTRVPWDGLCDRDDLTVEFVPGAVPMSGSAKALDVVIVRSEPDPSRAAGTRT
jgi:LuxR family glucitol operon transcriptional activator